MSDKFFRWSSHKLIMYPTKDIWAWGHAVLLKVPKWTLIVCNLLSHFGLSILPSLFPSQVTSFMREVVLDKCVQLPCMAFTTIMMTAQHVHSFICLGLQPLVSWSGLSTILRSNVGIRYKGYIRLQSYSLFRYIRSLTCPFAGRVRTYA